MYHTGRQQLDRQEKKDFVTCVLFVFVLSTLFILGTHRLLAANNDMTRAVYIVEDTAGLPPPPILPSAHAIAALDDLLARHGDDISVYFENLETGFVYSHNACRVYFSASVPKAMYALYIFKMAERGAADLDSLLEFTYGDANWGSGIIQRRYNFGATFTLGELLRFNISESDNVATNILRRTFGIYGYKNFIASAGGDPGLVRGNVMNSQLTAYEAGLFAREIFAYIQSGGRYSHKLKAHMLDNQFPFIVSCYPVASKTGWTPNAAWHDMAIVYAPSPFILVILTARYGFDDTDYADFAEISKAFQQFNDMWFVERGDSYAN